MASLLLLTGEDLKVDLQQLGFTTEPDKMRGMPSLVAAHWVSQKSGPTFRRLWTKVYRIKFAIAGVSVVCCAVFRLTMSCCIPEIFAIKSRSCPKSRRNLVFWVRQILGEETPNA